MLQILFDTDEATNTIGINQKLQTMSSTPPKKKPIDRTASLPSPQKIVSKDKRAADRSNSMQLDKRARTLLGADDTAEIDYAALEAADDALSMSKWPRATLQRFDARTTKLCTCVLGAFVFLLEKLARFSSRACCAR